MIYVAPKSQRESGRISLIPWCVILNPKMLKMRLADPGSARARWELTRLQRRPAGLHGKDKESGMEREGKVWKGRRGEEKERGGRWKLTLRTLLLAMWFRDGTGSPGYGSPGQRFWPGRVGSRVSVSDPVFDPVLSFWFGSVPVTALLVYLFQLVPVIFTYLRADCPCVVTM